MSFTACLACALALLASVATAAPASSHDAEVRTLEARVAEAPADTDARHALARAYARAGRFSEASAEYDALLARDAGNSDWLLGKAQVLIATERPAEALPLLERARSLAPAYEDVWQAEAIALEAAGKESAALELLGTAAKRFPDALWPRTRERRLRERRLAHGGSRLSANAAYENLSGPNASWRSAMIALDRPVRAGTRLGVAFAIEQRYHKQDEQLGLAVARRFGPHWAIDFGGEVAPEAELLPETQLHLEASRPITRTLTGSLRYRHAGYATVDVDALSAGTEYGFGDYRAAYTLTASKPSDIDARFGHALRLSRDYGLGSNVNLLLARGDEAETVAPGRVLVTRVTAVVLSGTLRRSTGWGLAWSCGWTEQGELYDRLGVRLGVERRF